MCGIVGLIKPSSKDLASITNSMLSAIDHRGPDSSSFWIGDGIALGNARLAIVDLSKVENQPITIDGFTLVFNGEIYNYKEIRNNLISLGRKFTTNSDTEVALQAFLQWGLKCFEYLNGMWAIAIYDSKAKTLVLSRDRLGVKPLYWVKNGSTFGFSSEIKGLLHIVPSRSVNTNYFANAFNSIGVDSDEGTPIREIFQVKPGTYLRINQDFSIESTTWWKLEASESDSELDDELSRFRAIFEDAVRIRIPTDVRYGFSLSGGLDSTAVFSCSAQNNHFDSDPYGVFNLSYLGGEMDESNIARETCDQYNRHLNVLHADPSVLFENIQNVVWAQEGIGWNPSILAYDFYYSRLKEFGIKVIVEGHGADEIFGGYPGMVREFLVQNPQFKNLADIHGLLKMINRGGNPEVGEIQYSSNLNLWVGFLRTLVNSRKSKFSASNRFNNKLISNEIFQSKEFVKIENPFPLSSFKSVTYNHTFSQTLPQVLRVFDRASMAHGVESRAPFLDYRLLELTMSLSDSHLLSQEFTKPIIRNSLASYIPNGVLSDNRKRGFGAPLSVVFNSPGTKRFLQSTEFSRILKDSQYINHLEMKNIIQSDSYNFTREEIIKIWQATTFAIWQNQFL